MRKKVTTQSVRAKSPSALFCSKLLALIVSLILILAKIWGGFALGLANTETFDLDQEQLLLPLITLFAVLLVFLSLALYLSMVLPTSGAVGLVTGFLLIASFFVTSLSQIDDALEPLNRFSPLKYYQGGAALDGLNDGHLLILLGLSALFIALAWFLFVKRNLRFGGTGWLRLVFPKGDEKVR